ncbi:MAG: amino acid decarboxylase [Clostridia bacterium]|jgi:arginine decarboxylase|nr:amino acid decarboxylase [Clostridia bacterium]NLS84081.1 amino acid decarboxylase [Oscillospiraceae bacterium]
MKTPIVDFVRAYAASDISRLHMPGHKGHSFLGCEQYDLTEIAGADSLYEADGIIAQSENNASALFNTAHTFYSTEGSSQCIRAMLYLALQNAPHTEKRPRLLAARNAHKTLVYSAALLDFDIDWLWSQHENQFLCSCPLSPNELSDALQHAAAPAFAVFVTSPDYLGNILDIAGLAAVCAAHNVPLLVDNAHGAYLHFLSPSQHPISLGATVCCDSAHKTLSALTGGAYLQISPDATTSFISNAHHALALFGSTSPSYLILQSLDLCNKYLAEDYPPKLSACIEKIDRLKSKLQSIGLSVLDTEPLKLTVKASSSGFSGKALAQLLRTNNVECEYADHDYLVLMFTPENTEADFLRIEETLQKTDFSPCTAPSAVKFSSPISACSIRTAIFAPHETIQVSNSVGRICASPTVSCPPAIPIVVSGEIIDNSAVRLFEYYDIKTVDVIAEL